MAASEGVDLEWAIVQLGRKEKLTRKYSNNILTQAKKALGHIEAKVGKKYKIFHSDEMGISASPEPKTDIVVEARGQKYFVSVKMEGGVQLASGQGRSTAELFRETAKAVFTDKKKLSEVESLAKVIEDMPTRLLAPQNLDRILEDANPKVLKEFTKAGKILKEKNAENWLSQIKPKLMQDISTFISKNPEFYSEMIREALTGQRTLARFKNAAANYILSPAGFYKIDDSYVSKVKSKVKLDIRSKSRGGITSIAFRIETRGNI
jgi:hypothetical protein